MKYLLSVLALSLLFSSCNDGDIITEALEFEDTYNVCGDLESEELLVVYKTKTDPNESLSLEVNSPETTLFSLFETAEDTDNPLLVVLIDEQLSVSVTGSNRFNYRTYDADPQGVFCNAIPSSGINITQDYLASGGLATFTVKLVEDDNDGIPAAFEDDNTDGDDDPSTNPTDTDGDGLPNYLDDDDDGDNVKTVTEQPNYSETDGLTLAQNTDADLTNSDTIPDYLDPDDDGDGVLTRNEENETQNQNPTDDIFNNAVGPDYLNEAVFTNVPATAYASHIIKQTFELELIITDLSLPILNQDFLNFGLLENQQDVNQKNRTVTPTF